MTQLIARAVVVLGLIGATLMAWGVPLSNSRAAGQLPPQGGTIRIAIGAATMLATLEDNQTARDLAARLPLAVTLRDFSPAEKVSDPLPDRLSQEGAPASDAGRTGDIAYYAPWGNIAFYRGEGPKAVGVIRIARIISGADALKQPGQLRATISRAE
jgi:hypothetical protein